MGHTWMDDSNWIWTSDWTEMDQAHTRLVYFRKTFSIEETVDQAIIKVSADSRYRLFVNGISVGFGPCKGSGFRWFYDEIDLAPYLKMGENVIAAVVLRYPATNLEGNQSIWRTETPGLYVKGTVMLSGGCSIQLDTNNSWSSFKGQTVTFMPEGGLNFLWILEDATGDEKLVGWNQTGYKELGWQEVIAYTNFQVVQSSSPGNLSARPIPALFEINRQFTGLSCLRDSSIAKSDWYNWLQKNNTITIPAHSTEIIEINAGELTTGFLQLMVAQGKASSIEILTSECYAYEPAEGKYMPVKGDRLDAENGQLYGFKDYYHPSGFGTTDQPEYYEPFWFRTFRFIQLKIVTDQEPLTLIRFDYRETGYPLEVKSQVQCSDPDMEKIWDISLRTLKRCMHETYEDCPFYEQLQYAMDARSQILFTYATSADDRLARKCMDDFHNSLRPDGLTNCSYPAFKSHVIPGFSLL